MAGKQYYSPKDIMEVLSVSKTEALRIMHMFEMRGQMSRFGERILRVKVKDFEAWENECYGEGRRA